MALSRVILLTSSCLYIPTPMIRNLIYTIHHAFNDSIEIYLHSSIRFLPITLWGTTLSATVQCLCAVLFAYSLRLHFKSYFFPNPFLEVILYICNIIRFLCHSLNSLLESVTSYMRFSLIFCTLKFTFWAVNFYGLEECIKSLSTVTVSYNIVSLS